LSICEFVQLSSCCFGFQNIFLNLVVVIFIVCAVHLILKELFHTQLSFLLFHQIA